MIVIMYGITYIYKYICRDRCNLRTLVVGIKALHLALRGYNSVYQAGGGGLTHHGLAEKIIYRRSGHQVIHCLHDIINA